MISEVEIRLRADIARLQQDMEQARKVVGGGLDKIDAAVGKTAGAFAGLAVSVGAVAFVHFVKGAIDATDALNDLSDRTQIAVTDLAALDYTARLSGTSLDGVAGAVSKLSVNIGKDSGKFRELGVTAQDPIEAFKQLADIFKSIQDPQQRAAFGAEALGKQWQEVAPTLLQGADGIDKLMARGRELSGVTDQVAADAGAFNDKLDELAFASEGTGKRIASALLPYLSQLVEDLTATSTATQDATKQFAPLTETFRAVVIAGGYVAYAFKEIGREIGAGAGQVNQVVNSLTDFINLDFKAGADRIRTAISIGDEAASDAAKASEAFDAWKKKWEDLGAAAKPVQDDIVKFMDEVDKAVESGAHAQQVATFLKAEEVAAARKKAAEEAIAAAKKENEAYHTTLAVINEKILSTKAELAGDVQLLDSQKMRIKLDQELKEGKLKLTDAHEKSVRAALDDLEAQEKLRRSAEQTKKALEELHDQRADDFKAAVKEADAAKDLVDNFNKSKLAIEKSTLARMEERLAQRASLELDQAEVDQLQRLIAVKKRAVASGDQLELLEKQKKATDEATKAQKDMWESIDRTAHDTFVSILEGNKSFAQRLKDTLKNTFFDWLYQMTVKKWIVSISAESNASGGLVGMLGSLFGSSGTGAASTAGATASKAVGSGTSALSSVAGYSGWIAVGMAIADGLFKKGFDANNFSAIDKKALPLPLVAESLLGNKLLQGIGLSSRTANILSGASIVSGLFGRAAPVVRGQGIQGTFTSGGFSGQAFADIFEKGGLFSHSKSYTRTSALAAETDATFDKTIQQMVASVKGFGDVLGVQTDVINGYSKAINIKLTEDDAKNQQLIAQVFGDIGNEMATRLVPNLAALATEGEKASDTLARVAGDYTALDQVLASIGETFGAVGVDSLAARERLISLSGGMQTLASDVSGFAQNFLTEAERQKPVMDSVTKALAEMGLGWVDTREEFKQVVLATDKTTEAGAKQFASLIALQGAFASLYPSTEELTAALQAQQKAQEEAAAAAAAAEKELRDKMLAGLQTAVSDTLTNLGTLVDAQKEQQKAAFDDLIAGINTGIDTTNKRVAKLRELSSALASTRMSAQTPAQAVLSRQVGAAQITAALAMAKASGVLPTADSLQFALSSLSQDISGQFATSEDYQRAQLRAANDIAALNNMAGAQTSIEEQTLQTLQDQKAAAQTNYDAQISVLNSLLDTARQQADAANRTADSVAQATTLPAALLEFSSALSALVVGRGADVPQSSLTQLAPGGTMSQDNIDALLYELQTLNAQMVNLKTQMERTAANTGAAAVSGAQLAQQFDQVSAGGNALFTELAPGTTVKTT